MAEAGSALILPSREQIVKLNRDLIALTGGVHNGADNFQYSASLEWVLDAIQYPLFGVERFSTLSEKAALLCWVIVHDHVFVDGNKRTGIATLKISLILNGYEIVATEDELVDIAIEITEARDSDRSQREFIDWVKARLRILNTGTLDRSPV